MTLRRTPPDTLAPTPERIARSLADGEPLRRPVAQTADATGSIGNPWRQMTAIDRLHAQNRITAAELCEAERFARHFHAAHLSGVKLASLETRVSGGGGGEPSEDRALALRDLGRMLTALPGQRLRSIAWDLIGQQTPMADWQRQRGLTPGHRQAKRDREQAEAAIIACCRIWVAKHGRK